MDRENNNIAKEKIRIFIQILPYNIRIAGLFDKKAQVGIILRFVKEKLFKLHLSFKPGRIELKENLYILLPEYNISDFLNDKDEIIVYSEDYGINQRFITDDFRIMNKKSITYLYHKFIGIKKKKPNKYEENNPKEKLKEKTEKNKNEKIKSKEKNKKDKKHKEKNRNYSESEKED